MSQIQSISRRTKAEGRHEPKGGHRGHVPAADAMDAASQGSRMPRGTTLFTLRKAVAFLLLVSAVYALAFVRPVTETAAAVMGRAITDPTLLLPWLIAAAGVFAGHVIRAWRGRLLFSTASDTGITDQLGAFCVGSLCNSILPLKIGELMRADVLAQETKTSFSFSFVLVLLERAIDATILCLMLMVASYFSVPLAMAAVVLAAIVIILWKSPAWFKSAVSSVSGVLADGPATKLRFKLWTVEYGLRRTMTTDTMGKYLVLSFANWCVYVLAFSPLIMAALSVNLGEATSVSVATFTALTTSLTPGGLGSFTTTLGSFGLSDPTLYIMLWCAAMIPAAAYGFVWTVTQLKGLPLLRRNDGKGDASLENKLARETDISDSQAAFLRDYYAGVPLATEISNDDIAGNAALIRYFTGGGSAAVTYLSHRDGKSYVTKRVAIGKEQSLREQYEWLDRYSCDTIVGVSSETEDDKTYSIDIDFDPDSVDGFDWVHRCTDDEARSFIDMTVDTLANKVWLYDEGLQAVSPETGRAVVEDYIDKHVVKCMEMAVGSLPSLADAMVPESLLINGEEHKNLNGLLEELRGNEAAMRDLSSYRTSPCIHGDIIVDNILYSRGKDLPVILDPVPCGNCFEGPVFDFGKMSQSLQIGYEFALRDKSKVTLQADANGERRVVEYNDMRSSAYGMLWSHVHDDIAPRYLTESERRTMLFIGATNYFRRMKHQAVQCPDNALKFYALGVRYLDRYMDNFR